MIPMPSAAAKIAAVIRAQVPRPAELPVGMPNYEHLRWRKNGRCPMGLLSGARTWCPTFERSFEPNESPGTDDELQAFADWWDSLSESDAAAAVDAVWGEAGRAG